jgi:NAD(P)-dependent dehydrogenase (short-subunit alcohol dehydrogenase family)
MNLFDLSGEVAVVIGATGALGGVLARGLAEAGAAVAVLGRNSERGKERVNQIEAAHGKAAFFTADAVDRASLEKARTAIEKSLGSPTILLNAAGGNDPKVTVTAEMPFEKIDLADWRANFDLNLVGGVLLPCQVFGPAMIERGRGSIINISSVSAHIPLSRVVAYSAAKAGVLNITTFLARACQFDYSGIFSSRAKSPVAIQRRRLPERANQGHLGTHANGPVRRSPRIGGRCGFPGELQGEQLCDGNGYLRGWRVPAADDLSRFRLSGCRTAEPIHQRSRRRLRT